MTTNSITLSLLALTLASGCVPLSIDCMDRNDCPDETGTSTTTEGDGDGDPSDAGTGDGDGDPSTGDGESETGDGDGDTGDGDTSGDGDGEPVGPCDADVTVTCGEQEDCWASSDAWTADAKATTQEIVDAMIGEPSIFQPVDFGVGDACWQVAGSTTHVCIVSACGVLLKGQPTMDFTLAPEPDCTFAGPWESTALTVTGKPLDACVGILNGIAVELRAK